MIFSLDVLNVNVNDRHDLTVYSKSLFLRVSLMFDIFNKSVVEDGRERGIVPHAIFVCL